MNPFEEQLKALHLEAQQQATKREEEARHQKQEQNNVDNVDFAKLMHDVVRLKDNGQYIHPIDKSPIKRRQQTEQLHEDSNNFYIGESGNWLDIPKVFSKNGQGSNDIKRLLAGHWEVVADVDLHGYTRDEAQKILNEFIEFVKKRGVCGEIIHGSGLGSAGYTSVLKPMVRRWLMQHPDVLAYVEPHKNNDGAVRILLKRTFNPNK